MALGRLDAKFRPYHAYLELLVEKFKDLRYTHLPRMHNKFIDVLATLTSMVDIPTDIVIRPLVIESSTMPTFCCFIDDAEIRDDLPWYHDIYQFLIFNTYTEATTSKDMRALRQLATKFLICGETLYRQSVDGMLLLCLDYTYSNKVMRKVYARVCRPQMGRHM